MSKPSRLDCREYEALVKRDWKPYTLGHRIMYQMPILMMTGGKFSVLDVGFGIGYGLDKMIEAEVLERFVGYEPNEDSYNYVAPRYEGHPFVRLYNEPFMGACGSAFDHVTCIEVAEHVPDAKHDQFLKSLRAMTAGTLWFSTPDLARCKSGARTKEDWYKRLKAAGFDNVTVHEEQWTTLFIAQ